MSRFLIYIAMSLDGYIADASGSVDWLKGDGSEPDALGTYASFSEGIDTIILGRKTYDQIVNDLSPDVWPYVGKKTYVLSHSKSADREEVSFTNQPIQELAEDLKAQAKKDIWICGGANLINQFLEEGLVDQLCVTIVPVILGNGIPLFDEGIDTHLLQLVSTETYNGFTDLVYKVR